MECYLKIGWVWDYTVHLCGMICVTSPQFIKQCTSNKDKSVKNRAFIYENSMDPKLFVVFLCKKLPTECKILEKCHCKKKKTSDKKDQPNTIVPKVPIQNATTYTNTLLCKCTLVYNFRAIIHLSTLLCACVFIFLFLSIKMIIILTATYTYKSFQSTFYLRNVLWREYI